MHAMQHQCVANLNNMASVGNIQTFIQGFKRSYSFTTSVLLMLSWLYCSEGQER